jgi:hypothetical protein
LHALSLALSEQFQIIIHDKDNTENVIPQYYQKFLNHSDQNDTSDYSSLYPSDSFWNDNQMDERHHVVSFYEVFTHTWNIRNTGKVEWRDRKLKWIKSDKPSPRPSETLISIPHTPPGEVFTLYVQYDARGSEGIFKSEWIMVDSDDNNCFPNPFGSLDVYITVNNTLLDKFGGE